jgi:hypothetical protein
MFRSGDIVTGPFPATEADLNIGTHYLVVLDSNKDGAIVMFTTSLKSVTGGNLEFTSEERSAAKFTKPSRFDPSRLAFFRSSDLNKLLLTGGHLNRRSLQRLIDASVRVKATYVVYRAALRVLAAA